MNEIVCTACSRPLPPDAPESLCPYCLLAMGEHEEPLPTTALGGRFEPPEPGELQRHFDPGQLQVLNLVGSGGMGAVYHARQPRLMRDVALKILPPELATGVGFDDRFTREARVLAKLDHPHVVDVHDFGRAGPYSYLMLEYVDGVNLRQLLMGGLMSPGDALEIIPQICEALQYAHDEGIVHRDIKPENILIDQNGHVKITDFGLAKLARPDSEERNLTGTHQVMGTPNYMAPEQIEKPRQVDHRADIYAMGVVFYELLTGELPLGRFDPPSRKGTGPRRLDKVVMKTLEKEPERRYHRASEVKDDVEKVSVDKAGAAARHAAEFVAGSASSAVSHPVVGQAGFFLAIAGYYLALFLAVLSLGDAWLLTPFMLAIAGGLSFIIDQVYPRMPEHAYIRCLCIAPRWTAAKLRRIWMRLTNADEDDSLIPDRDALLDMVPLICSAAATWLFFIMGSNDEFFFGAMLLLLVGYVSARVLLKQRDVTKLSSRERWLLYPPIVIVLMIILVPLITAPPIGVAAILIENSYSGGLSTIPSGFTRVAFGTALTLLTQFLWLGALVLIASIARPAMRWLAFPFLIQWDGKWTATGAVACAISSVLLAMTAWTIATV